MKRFFWLCLALSSLFATESMHFDLRHTEPNGVGFDHGYTTLEAYLMPGDHRKAYPFLDIRNHVFNNGRAAFNTGCGARIFSDERIWGCNVYYDFRSARKRNFNQVSLGLETLGCIWDAYMNGYLVVGEKRDS